MWPVVANILQMFWKNKHFEILLKYIWKNVGDACPVCWLATHIILYITVIYDIANTNTNTLVGAPQTGPHVIGLSAVKKTLLSVVHSF